MNTRWITTCALAMLAATASAIPPVAPGSEGRLAEPHDIRIFEIGQSYRLTYSTNMTIPMMGAGGEIVMTFHMGLDVAAGQQVGATVANMTIDRIVITHSMDGAEETMDSDDPASDAEIREVVGTSFVGDVGPDGKIVSFAVTEEGLQRLQRSDMGEMLDAFVGSFEKMLTDCMYYAPGPGLDPGDTWDLAREITPGFDNYMLMMMASGQVSMAEEATCTLESIGGDGTPTIVTFTGTQQLLVPPQGARFDLSPLAMAVAGRAEFDPAGEVPLRIVRQTTTSLPAELAGGQVMNVTTTDRITLTPPGVDAPAPPDDDEEGLPDPPVANGGADPTTQPATRPAPVDPPEQQAEPMAPLPPGAVDDEPTTQPGEEASEAAEEDWEAVADEVEEAVPAD